ncbi:MAG: Na+/H+ antiporter NhaA [Planctomycetota bacterium]
MPFDKANRELVASSSHDTISIIEYGDYGCADCQKLHQVLKDVRDEPGEPVEYIFRHLPFQNNAGYDSRRAIAAQAAARQQKFWKMHDALFDNFDVDDVEEQIQNAARQAELDTHRLAHDREDPVLRDEVIHQIEMSFSSGIQRTPTLLIDGVEYSGTWDFESIREAIRPPVAARVRALSQEFASWAASGGVVLIVFSILALLWRNSFWTQSYEHLWEMSAGFSIDRWSLMMPLSHWVNDLFMAIFFLVVGLELKRELTSGELADPKRAALPVASAIGGMIVPAGIFLMFNAGTSTSVGWGVPMATDIAFTLGVLALLGPCVPMSLKVFAAALAIADDLGAILVLAFAYNHGMSVPALVAAMFILGLLFVLNRIRVYRLWPYLSLGVALWVAVYSSGLHATLAGVLLASTIPTRRRASLLPMLAQGSLDVRESIDRLEKREVSETIEHKAITKKARTVLDRLEPPALRLEHLLQPWSSYLVLPIFALSNAGIAITANSFSPTSGLTLGIILGLVLGKPIGIVAGAWLIQKAGLGQKPVDASWPQVFGVGLLCGIGFTMSIFIGSEAFADGPNLSEAKIAVMLASTIAAILGFVFLRSLPTRPHGVE